MDFKNRVLIKGWTGGAFLAESPEAFGLVSDAHPVATGELLLAVNGYAADDGMHPPTFTVSGKGIEGLYEGLFHRLLTATDAHNSLLRLTFGESEGRQVHPIARYSALYTEALAYDILTGEGRELSLDDCAALLTERLPDGIDRLRDTMRDIVGPRPGSERFFSVSFFACRVTEAGQGRYFADVFTAGDFSLYLLDERGLCPLWTRATELLSGDETGRVECCRLTVDHEGPFALIALSRSACEPSLADRRSMGEHPGLIWRHRMRMEEHILRLLSAGADLADASERAARFFGGRSVGWDSASGAAMICGGGFESLKSKCPDRLRRLEDLTALLPNGYDPEEVMEQVPREMADRDFILTALRTRPRLQDKTIEVLSRRATEILRTDSGLDLTPVSEEGLRRLTYEDVRGVFESYDGENREDRARIEANDGMLRSLLSEHWMTLRPVLCRGMTPDEHSEAAFDACARMGRSIARLTAHRRRLVSQIEKQLTESLVVLKFQSEDWILGRGGDDSPDTWLDGIAERLPKQAEDARREWRRTAGLLRGLRSAYTAEREKLFKLDALSPEGVWHESFERLSKGTLTADEWRTYREDTQAAAPAMAEPVRMLEALSLLNGALYRRIESRAAERLALQAISTDEEWQISCLLGALNEDEAWGEACLSMIDHGFRNEYRALCRRRQEEQELMNRRREAFETYKDMYETYELTF